MNYKSILLCLLVPMCMHAQQSRVERYKQTIHLQGMEKDDYLLSETDYINKVRQKEQSAQKILRAWKLEKEDPEFARRESIKIRCGYGNMLIMYPISRMGVTGKMDYAPSDTLRNALRSFMVEDGTACDIPDYLMFMSEAANQLAQNFISRGGKAIQRPINIISWAADSIQNDTVMQRVMHMPALNYVQYYGIKDIDEMTNLYYTYVTEDSLLQEFQKECDLKNPNAPGTPSPRFIAQDVERNIHTLDEFKGKYVYIDIWATWCNPCRKQIPFMEKLIERYEGKNIAFVSLSMDASKDKEKWREMARGMKGCQYWIGQTHDFLRFYDVQGIPRFILIDPEGKIVKSEMTPPSDPATIEFLDKL